MFARLVKRGSEYYLVIKVVAGARTARVRLSELGRRGALIRRTTLVVGTGKETVRLPYTSAVRSVKVPSCRSPDPRRATTNGGVARRTRRRPVDRGGPLTAGLLPCHEPARWTYADLRRAVMFSRT
jgi:hypothetical protein